MIKSKEKVLAMAVLTAILGTGYTSVAAAADPSFDLPKIIVEGKRVLPGGFVRENSPIGIIGTQDVMSAPFSVTTVDKKAFDVFAQSAEGVAGALSLDPSVRVDRAGSTYTDYTIRGIYVSGHSAYINGIPGLLGQQNIPFYWADSATVISGPNQGVSASILNEAVAGTVTYNSKKAEDKDITQMKLGYRGGKSFEQGVDVGRRFGKDKQWGIRITANNIGGETSTENDRLSQQQLFMNVDHQSSRSKTNLLLGYAHTKSKGGPNSWRFHNVSYIPKAPDASKLYKPDWFYNEYENWIAALNHEQKLTDHLSAYLNAGYHKENWFGYIDGQVHVSDDDGNFYLSPDHYPLYFTRKYLGAGFKGDFKIGSVKNEYTVGVERHWYTNDGGADPSFAPKYYGNMHQHNHWDNPGEPAYYDAPFSRTTQMSGWHVVDTLKAIDDRLQVTLGVHGHKAKNMPKNGDAQKSDAICPTYAVSYKTSPAVTIYAGHTESFGMGTYVSSTNYANQGTTLDPAKSKQNEIGVKIKTGKFLNSFDLFKIEQENTIDTYRTGEPKPFLTVDGKQEYKGAEWKVTGTVFDKLDLMGGIMYLNAKQKAVNTAALNGQPVSGAAKWSGTMGAIYHFDKNWDAIGRLSFVGKSNVYNQSNEKLDVPSYTKFDLGAAYKTKISGNPVKFQLMCYNLFGRDYWVPRAGQNSWHLALGAPRTVTFSATFEF